MAADKKRTKNEPSSNPKASAAKGSSRELPPAKHPGGFPPEAWVTYEEMRKISGAGPSWVVSSRSPHTSQSQEPTPTAESTEQENES